MPDVMVVVSTIPMMMMMMMMIVIIIIIIIIIIAIASVIGTLSMFFGDAQVIVIVKLAPVTKKPFHKTAGPRTLPAAAGLGGLLRSCRIEKLGRPCRHDC